MKPGKGWVGRACCLCGDKDNPTSLYVPRFSGLQTPRVRALRSNASLLGLQFECWERKRVLCLRWDSCGGSGGGDDGAIG